jgi:hypothetical protein
VVSKFTDSSKWFPKAEHKAAIMCKFKLKIYHTRFWKLKVEAVGFDNKCLKLSGHWKEGLLKLKMSCIDSTFWESLGTIFSKL